MWLEARREAGLPESLVLYCARHTFGTAVYEATGNLTMVMKVMVTPMREPQCSTSIRRWIRFVKPSISATCVTIHVTVNFWCSEKQRK
jgi:hypothetical protein